MDNYFINQPLIPVVYPGLMAIMGLTLFLCIHVHLIHFFTIDLLGSRIKRDLGFISDYANHTDIFYHRSMEKDRLSILDVWSAYGQKDIERLDRSEINKPARDGG